MHRTTWLCGFALLVALPLQAQQSTRLPDTVTVRGATQRDSALNAMAQRHAVAVGMTPAQVRTAWGPPDHINQTVTAEGVVLEQWVYSGPQYLYFPGGGTLTLIQTQGP
jgi:hypothetical protein